MGGYGIPDLNYKKINTVLVLVVFFSFSKCYVPEFGTAANQCSDRTRATRIPIKVDCAPFRDMILRPPSPPLQRMEKERMPDRRDARQDGYKTVLM